MTFKEIQELIRLVSKSDLTEFKVKDGEFELSIRTKLYTSRHAGMTVGAPPLMAAPMSAPSQEMHAPQPSSAEPSSSTTQPVSNNDAPKIEAGKKYQEIKSPMVGTFYRSQSPDKPPYVKVGDRIESGSIVCVVEAMKLFNEIESDVTGKIVKVMVEDAQPVEYDQVLFLVEP